METTQLTEALASKLEERGIDRELASEKGLHALRNGSGNDALVIPFFREGKVVNRKFRTLGAEKKFWQDKGGIKCVWNEDILRDESLFGTPLIITEGEIDALTAIQCGFTRTVSVPDGAPAEIIVDENSVKYSFLDGAKGLFAVDRVPEIILAVDGDDAGANLLHDLSIRLGKYRCKFLTYPMHPDGSKRLKDLNEVLHHYGQAGVKKTLERAAWMKVDGIYRMSELPPVAHAPIYDIGMPVFRDHYKARLGDMAVWTGIPSHGKSSLVNDVCCRLVEYHGLNVAFASFEQSPQRDHKRNLRTWKCGRPVQHCTVDELKAADRWIDQHFTFMVPSEDDDVSLDWVLDRMEAAVIQHGCKVVVIDPWNEMDHNKGQGESLTEYVGRAIKTLKRFARKLMIHLIVVAHPAKPQKDEKGNYRVPTLYDISDSAHWYNKADLGVVVHRESDNLTLIKVAKSRYHDEIGVPGEFLARFHFEARRFEPLVAGKD